MYYGCSVYLGCTRAGGKGGVRDVDVQAQVDGASAHSVLDLVRYPVKTMVVQLRAEDSFHALSGTSSIYAVTENVRASGWQLLTAENILKCNAVAGDPIPSQILHRRNIFQA